VKLTEEQQQRIYTAHCQRLEYRRQIKQHSPHSKTVVELGKERDKWPTKIELANEYGVSTGSISCCIQRITRRLGLVSGLRTQPGQAQESLTKQMGDPIGQIQNLQIRHLL
jgi:hypothetical protein